MDRSVAYTQEQGRSTDFLFAQRASMIGLAKLAKSILGSNTLVEGLGVTANSPAALNVVVGSGQIYSLAAVDASAYGILAADTTHTILKQGLLMDALTLSTPAPATSGYSINYLIQATFSETDTNPLVLPYFNSANPSQPLSGQNNTGSPQATQRQDLCIVAAKAGAAATTGTQTTPAPDAGYVGLAVVVVAFGQSTVTAGNISIYAGAPYLVETLTQKAYLNGNAAQAFAVANATAANQAVALGQFVTSITANGYIKLPDGLIIQWGGATITAANTFQNFTLPVTFPGAGLQVATSFQNGTLATQQYAINAYLLNASTITASAAAAAAFAYVAIGF
jgi:hypothetical protein